jgi:hypothetical protein
MLEAKTHFEQIPLEIVRKIVEEQVRKEVTIEDNQETGKKTPEEVILRAGNNQWPGPLHLHSRGYRRKL